MNRWLQPEFKDAFPVACIMKHRLPQLWVRVHSLPESKRYPETEEERSIVMERYASFGTALLGDQSACYIVRSRMNEEELEPKYRGSFTWSSLPKVDESDEDFWSSWYAETMWRPEEFRTLLLDVAEERDWGVSFVSKVSGSIFAPYDGGADGFSFDPGLLSRLKHEFQPWLSARDDGL
jgi:hypothetical protein